VNEAGAVDYDPFSGGEIREFPAVPAQRGIWVHSKQHPQSACAHNDAVVVRLKGPLDQTALGAALQALAELHEALRGRFADEGRRLVVAPAVTVPVEQHDLSRIEPETARAGALETLLAADAQTPYDLEAGPLLRAKVVRLEEREHVVLLGVHRTVCDGWSLDVLLYDLGRLYSAFSGEGALPPPPGQGFSDYVAHRATPEFAARARSSLAFWRAALASPPDGRARVGRRPPGHDGRDALHAALAVPPDVVAAARGFARDAGLSFFSVLLSTAGLALHRASGADDVVVAVPVAGQPDAAMEECVGYLTSTLPIRIRLAPGGSFRQLAENVTRAVLDAREHAAVDLCEIAAELAIGDEPFAPGFVDAVFTHVQKHAPGKLRFAGCAAEYHFNPRRLEVFDFGLGAFDAATAVELSAFAVADAGEAAWLGSRLAEFELLLREGCERPDDEIPR
jgi:hypothetical protein